MEKRKFTIQEFAAMNNWDYLTASSMMKVLVEIGDAKEVGKRSNPGQRGKPSVVFEVERVTSMHFWEDEAAPVENNLPPVENTVDNGGIIG